MHNTQNFAPERRIFLATQQDTELATEYDSCIHAFRSSNADRDVAWVETPDKANCIILFEEWSTKFWNYPQTLLADPFFIKYWQSIVTINCDDLGRGFLPGCYTSLIPANFDSTLHCASAYPYTYNHLVQQTQSYQSPESKWLFSFRGNRGVHVIRSRLFELFASFPDALMVDVGTRFHTHTCEQKATYIADVLASKFVLCPRGWGPATYRMFEVMELGRCPVIISDDWIPIEGIDWAKCALFVRERNIAAIPNLLRDRESEAKLLGKNARAIWLEHFSDRQKFRHMFDCAMKINRNLQKSIVDYRTRWNSWGFYRSNGWLLYQRVGARAARLTVRV